MVFREPDDAEKRLLRELARRAGIDGHDTWLRNLKVRGLSDGGMGSLELESSVSADRSGVAVELATLRFLDDDDVWVVVTLNGDVHRVPLELDVWKTDFSPVHRIPPVFEGDENRKRWEAMATYWRPVIDLCHRRKLEARVAVDDGKTRFMSDWSPFLIMPVDGYLEFSPAPVPIRHVQWVDLCTACLETIGGGLRPKELEGLRAEAELVGRAVSLKQTWRIDISAEVGVIRVLNPFFHSPRRDT